MRSSAVFLLLLETFVSWQSPATAATPAEMLRWIPADANAIVIVDVDNLFSTPLAKKEDWRKQAADAFVNHELAVPPEARRVLFASQIGLGSQFNPEWELGVFDFERTPSFAAIARREGGQLDTVAAQSAVSLGKATTIVELAPGAVLGTSQPNRQTITRWISSAKKQTSPQVSAYLVQATKQIGSATPVVLALDLSDCTTVPSARAFLASLESLKDKAADQNDLAELVASVKGATLTVHVTQRREGKLRIEFDRPTAVAKPYARELLSEVLHATQASLDDIESWSFNVDGTSITWSGELSPGSLRRLIALLVPASAGAGSLQSEEPNAATTVSPEAKKAATSQRYFRSVKDLIDELHQTLHKTRDNHAVWFERYARKVDDLPMKDVDKDLLTFGGNVSSSFRYQAQAKRMAGVRSGVREAQPNYATYGGYRTGYANVGPYGSYGNYSWSATVRVEPNRGQIRTEEQAVATQVKVSEWKEIEDGLVQIRRAMTERYNVEF